MFIVLLFQLFRQAIHLGLTEVIEGFNNHDYPCAALYDTGRDVDDLPCDSHGEGTDQRGRGCLSA